MIPNERLQALIKYYKRMDVDEGTCGNERVNTNIRDFYVALQELLTLRHEKQLLIENSERFAGTLTDELFLHLKNSDGVRSKIIGGLLKQHNDLMKQVKPFVGDSDHDKDDRIL